MGTVTHASFGRSKAPPYEWWTSARAKFAKEGIYLTREPQESEPWIWNLERHNVPGAPEATSLIVRDNERFVRTTKTSLTEDLIDVLIETYSAQRITLRPVATLPTVWDIYLS